ncbi:hypothetical protein [Roseitalea porphyridii]|uniref:Uncharacterized protein n=1 Tax=Roseitalea porphyridii TaxID=1852022 RepID=A0A4P6V387_9HYPH|nr:hypothetical protein [Roseitalea porphyridii]QBK31363.1 hypothetical protein E0E05_12565 [Roseitalea porphyridii]
MRYDGPGPKAPATAQVDYLEMESFLDQYGRASVLGVIDDEKLQTEEPDEDIVDDAVQENARAVEIENEVNARKHALGAHYPFDLDATGDNLEYQTATTPAQNTYVACLICAFLRVHGTRGWDKDLRHLELRFTKRVFQTVGTLVLAAQAGRGAISLGWPRLVNEPIIAALKRGWQRGSTIEPHETPTWLAPPADKDGGIDVIGWSDWPYGSQIAESIILGQLASGMNWEGKSVRDFIDTFRQSYVRTWPENRTMATVIPFRRTNGPKAASLDIRHGAVFDRLSLPTKVAEAEALAAQGRVFDEIENVDSIRQWVDDYRTAVLAL